MKELIQEFQCGEPESGSFRYCGKEIVQDHDFNIKVTCTTTTMKLKPISITSGREDFMKLNESEQSQVKSVEGSLDW